MSKINIQTVIPLKVFISDNESLTSIKNIIKDPEKSKLLYELIYKILKKRDVDFILVGSSVMYNVDDYELRNMDEKFNIHNKLLYDDTLCKYKNSKVFYHINENGEYPIRNLVPEYDFVFEKGTSYVIDCVMPISLICNQKNAKIILDIIDELMLDEEGLELDEITECLKQAYNIGGDNDLLVIDYPDLFDYTFLKESFTNFDNLIEQEFKKELDKFNDNNDIFRVFLN